MSRILTAIALSASLALGACQHPDGSTDWGSTLLVGAGVGTAAALIAGAASDGGGRHHFGSRRHAGYDHGGHGYRGYGRGRGW